MSKSCIVFALLVGFAFATLANASDGTINFIGSVVGAACVVTPGTANQTVSLGAISAATLPSPGSSSESVHFEISISECSDRPVFVRVRFEGQSDGNGLLRLIAAGSGTTATGVGVGLYDGYDESIQIPVGSESFDMMVFPGASSILWFAAKYVATGTVTAGVANAVANFTLVYN